MSNNFRRTAVLTKNINCKVKLHPKDSTEGVTFARRPRTTFLKFSIHLSVSPSKNYIQIYGKSKASLWRNLSTGTPQKFLSAILCFVALVYKSYFFQNSRFTGIIQH